jgi:hypothetical protein
MMADSLTQHHKEPGNQDARYTDTLLGQWYFSEKAWQDIQKEREKSRSTMKEEGDTHLT